MGQDIKLTASDNFQLGAYRADPSGAPKGAVVVIQEIFGVNHHIRSVCDRIAEEGYVAIAPSIFDRTSPNFQSGYTPDEIAEARKFVASPDWDAMLRDTQAAIDAVKSVGPVGIIGFCLGGSVAFVAATRLSGLKAAIGYYGGAVVRFADEKPKVPTQLHFGEKDAGIPLTDVETVKAKRPDVAVFIYPGAQHGFHCDERPSYDKASSDVAWPRSMEFFAKHLTIARAASPLSFRDAPQGRRPESITTNWGYGFSDAQLRIILPSRPGMTERVCASGLRAESGGCITAPGDRAGRSSQLAPGDRHAASHHAPRHPQSVRNHGRPGPGRF